MLLVGALYIILFEAQLHITEVDKILNFGSDKLRIYWLYDTEEERGGLHSWTGTVLHKVIPVPDVAGGLVRIYSSKLDAVYSQ